MSTDKSCLSAWVSESRTERVRSRAGDEGEAGGRSPDRVIDSPGRGLIRGNGATGSEIDRLGRLMDDASIKEIGLLPAKDRPGARTPMRCPVCDSDLGNVRIRDLGGVTADLTWQLHAGECPDHGWFQTEVISRPPREIFAVDRPFGVARRMVIDGEEIYAFATIWNDVSAETKRSRVDPLDARYWQVRRIAYRL